MNSNIDFSGLWNQQSTAAPGIDELIGKAKALQNKARLKLIGASLLLVSTMFFIGWIWFNIDPKLTTTTAGIIITILAIVMSLVYSMGIIKLLFQKDPGVSSTFYLEQLVKLKQKQEFVHRVIMSIYFIMLSLGVFLYMIEFTLKMKLIWGILAYLVTAAWFAFNWFYLRPKTIKKQQTEINKLISEFERVNKQFSEG